MREKQIEQKLVKAVKAEGGMCPKLVSPGTDGMPDRMVLLPEAHIGPKGGAGKWLRFYSFRTEVTTPSLISET